MIILGIETSCDETAAAVVKKTGSGFEIKSSIVSSQIAIHRKYGGVVPEVAAREHIKNIIPVIEQALEQSKTSLKKVDAIAVTAGPGLVTSLLVGVETAKHLAYTLEKPLIPVNHLKAHLYASLAENPTLGFPAIGLIVSGGHTELILMKNARSFKKIGATVDDAAGEAFDKVAALLHLGYPGGPIVSKHALSGDATKFNFPRPMMKTADYSFSFSGLKTAVRYMAEKVDTKNPQVINDLCASFQQAVVEVLVTKTVRAAKEHKAKTIIVAGGVAANKSLRASIEVQAAKNNLPIAIPAFNLCTDNAAMIAIAGFFAKSSVIKNIKADPAWEL